MVLLAASAMLFACNNQPQQQFDGILNYHTKEFISVIDKNSQELVFRADTTRLKCGDLRVGDAMEIEYTINQDSTLHIKQLTTYPLLGEWRQVYLAGDPNYASGSGFELKDKHQIKSFGQTVGQYEYWRQERNELTLVIAYGANAVTRHSSSMTFTINKLNDKELVLGFRDAEFKFARADKPVVGHFKFK